MDRLRKSTRQTCTKYGNMSAFRHIRRSLICTSVRKAHSNTLSRRYVIDVMYMYGTLYPLYVNVMWYDKLNVCITRQASLIPGGSYSRTKKTEYGPSKSPSPTINMYLTNNRLKGISFIKSGNVRKLWQLLQFYRHSVAPPLFFNANQSYLQLPNRDDAHARAYHYSLKTMSEDQLFAFPYILWGS